MSHPIGWQNPIVAATGQTQTGVDAAQLLPNRSELIQSRLAQQRMLMRTKTPRFTPIQVTVDGVIWDGHHAVRAAAEQGDYVEVLIVPISELWSGVTILQLPVR